MRRECVIVDIDGTIADNAHRLPLVMGKKRDYVRYHAMTHLDTPIEPMLNMVRGIIERSTPVVFLTGRPESVRGVTEDWLDIHLLSRIRIESPNLWFSTSLVMRETDDHSKSMDFKRRELDRIRESGVDPVMAIEDRADIVRMFRDEGLICLDVGERF